MAGCLSVFDGAGIGWLVRGGRSYVSESMGPEAANSSFVTEKAPRTAAGVLSNGSLVLVQVDGQEVREAQHPHADGWRADCWLGVMVVVGCVLAGRGCWSGPAGAVGAATGRAAAAGSVRVAGGEPGWGGVLGVVVGGAGREQTHLPR